MESSFKVPIRNLFCLLSYVNDMPELINSMNDVDEELITYDFLACRFLYEAERLQRRGLIKDYVAISESTNRLGGRLLINESIPYLMENKPMVVCEKDHYSPNILFNQIMKSILKSLSQNRFIKEHTRRRSFLLMDALPEVEAIPLTKAIFAKLYYGRHNRHYEQMLNIARLLHDLKLLSHKNGNWNLFSAEIEEKALNRIFEKFLFNFYKFEQSDYRVSSETMKWNLDGNSTLLPSMVTDVSLTHHNGKEKIVIDAKFYRHVFQEHFGKASFHSHNMYQLFTYLMHQPQDLSIRGILIYPYNGYHVDENYNWDERIQLGIKTVNLDDSWKEINNCLIKIVKYYSC